MDSDENDTARRIVTRAIAKRLFTMAKANTAGETVVVIGDILLMLRVRSLLTRVSRHVMAQYWTRILNCEQALFRLLINTLGTSEELVIPMTIAIITLVILIRSMSMKINSHLSSVVEECKSYSEVACLLRRRPVANSAYTCSQVPATASGRMSRRQTLDHVSRKPRFPNNSRTHSALCVAK